MKTILILEDNDERIAAFRNAIANLGRGFEVKVWRDARAMIAECEAFFPTAALISLGHDLKPILGSTADPGTGMDVATFLADFMPVCPVLIHSSNTNAVTAPSTGSCRSASAARKLAQEYFSTEKVLPALLEAAMS